MFILSAVAVGPALTMAIAYIVEWVTGKKSIPDEVSCTIARFSGFALLVYGYIRLWDLAAVTYYGRTPSVSEAFNLLSQQTPYNFSFWVFEIILGIFLPAVLFLTPRFNRNPGYLVMGAIFAVLGILINRW
jgi:Ni/Fe-hydrogenase subunit HybB-like protein